MPESVLIVDDEPAILAGLLELFASRGYQVTTAANGKEADGLLSSRDFDVVILDVMMPGMSGFEVLDCERRRGKNTPVLMLTARGADAEKVAGLLAGADDYVTKPFSNAELAARVEALIRRSRQAPVADRIRASGVVIDMPRHVAIVGGVENELTAREVGIVRYLFANRHRTVSRHELLVEVWGYPDVNVETRTVENHIAKLRQKIEVRAEDPVLIRTVRGEGYRFGGTVE